MKYIRVIAFFLCILTYPGYSQTRVSYFYGVPNIDSNTVKLNLTISAGPGCAGWQILHGSDSVNLSNIYSYGGLCGNTSYAETYSYLHYSPNKATPNFYRIYIPPNDYSSIIQINMATNPSNLLIFPQPAEDVLNIKVSNKTNFYYEITIYDRFGRKKGFGSGNALDKISLSVAGLSEGVYVFYIFDSSGASFRGKFLKNASD